MNETIKPDTTRHLVKDEGTFTLFYSLTEIPPWYTSILLGFQHYLTGLGGLLAVPLLLGPALCLGPDDVGIADIFSTVVFVSGINTLIQTTFGARLPVLQGTSFTFLVPTFALLNLPKWQCPETTDFINSTMYNESMEIQHVTSPIWHSRIREVQGCILLASLFQVIFGVTGVVGVFLRYIGPLAVGPTITLIGLGLFQPAAGACQGQWWIAIATMLCVAVFVTCLDKRELPCYGLSKDREKSCLKSARFIRKGGLPVFALFPMLLSICVMWVICYILTETNTLPSDPTQWGHLARTDAKIKVLHQAKWFRFPYPFQWGTPTFSVAGVFGMLSAVIAGIIESIGDYYASARLCGVPPPPVHAINRGILLEGVGNVLCGLWGTGNGTTTFTENIGALGITKVGSRIVMQVTAIIMLLLGVLGKFGALFVTLPQPIIGGVFMITCGMITSVGISILGNAKLSSSRNLFIVGFSVFFGLSMPMWLISNPTSINTGNEVVDQVFTVLLSTSCLVGGCIGFIMDNVIPGTEEERGIDAMRLSMIGSENPGENKNNSQSLVGYDLPWCMGCVKGIKCCQRIPFCPTFINASCSCVQKNTEQSENNNIEKNTTNSVFMTKM